MTRHENMTNAETDALNAAQVEFSANPRFLAPQAKNFFQAQERILDEMGKFSAAWFKRRQDATNAMIKAGRHIISEGRVNPADAMKVITDLQARSIERLTEDAKDYAEMMTRCTGTVVASEIEAVENTVETAKQVTKSRHATPV